jgi:5'-3' exonuclease
MGIPKFYRWLSERMPLMNQAISDLSLLPEFGTTARSHATDLTSRP